MYRAFGISVTCIVYDFYHNSKLAMVFRSNAIASTKSRLHISFHPLNQKGHG